eukprot:NODE_18949_length_866_cov_8.428958.p1 GENE.NODE_18949_length_866_cov_8.428958~~NODE_18949_length_866_cov_8.428958.p1  ORF type:complete len:116 (-),score=23.51 NODE_18949_length_866_cov_8.428958:422-769(-)
MPIQVQPPFLPFLNIMRCVIVAVLQILMEELARPVFICMLSFAKMNLTPFNSVLSADQCKDMAAIDDMTRIPFDLFTELSRAGDYASTESGQFQVVEVQLADGTRMQSLKNRCSH